MLWSFVADRYQYLAGIGVMAVLIGGAAHGAGKLPGTLKIGIQGMACVVLVLLGILTWRQASIYAGEIAFYSHIISLNPQARDAHYNLGIALLKDKRTEEGLAATRTALQQRPDHANAHSNAGVALILLRRYDEAEKHLHRALELDPNHAIARDNLAELHRRKKQAELKGSGQ